MRKFIFVMDAIELFSKLMNGKRVQGVLYIDENTGKLTFKANSIKAKKRLRDHLICRLEHGWVKESEERIKVFESVPKELGTSKMMSILDREHNSVKDVLIERELDLIEFC